MTNFDPTKKRMTRITTAPLITPILRAEIENTTPHEVQADDHVGITIGANLAECQQLCLNLRTALHVMWSLKQFRCPSPQALYTHAASIPWEELIPNDGYFSVSSSVDNPKITNSMYPNLVLKDAIVDRISKQTGARPDSGSDKSKVVINLYWKGDRAWIYLNVNGRRLADRGYRRIPHSAPMQETLAAAVLLAANYDGAQQFINPMCGAGTLAIEAALIATNRAPGLLRDNFSFMHTLLFDDDAWKTMRIATKKKTSAQPPMPIVASDHDPHALDAARKNAQTAGVEQLIDFQERDFADTQFPADLAPDAPGLVIMNPEYGERLGEVAELETTYQRIGDFFKKNCQGKTCGVFTGNRELAKHIRLRTKRKIPFMNATIDCRLLEYEMYAGSRETRKPKAAEEIPPTSTPLSSEH